MQRTKRRDGERYRFPILKLGTLKRNGLLEDLAPIALSVTAFAKIFEEPVRIK